MADVRAGGGAGCSTASGSCAGGFAGATCTGRATKAPRSVEDEIEPNTFVMSVCADRVVDRAVDQEDRGPGPLTRLWSFVIVIGSGRPGARSRTARPRASRRRVLLHARVKVGSRLIGSMLSITRSRAEVVQDRDLLPVVAVVERAPTSAGSQLCRCRRRSGRWRSASRRCRHRR